MAQPTKESFLKDVKNHMMEIKKDDGLYRHLIFSNNGSYINRFEIVTFPGNLVYTGDMGTYTFQRLTDMFEFFRSKRQDINEQYWAEKVTSESTFGDGIQEFSVEQFRYNVVNSVISYLELEENENMPQDIVDEIAVLLDCDNEWDCVCTMNDFYSDKVKFHDFWEYKNKAYTYHYIWCCYAIVYAIEQYDKYKVLSETNPCKSIELGE